MQYFPGGLTLRREVYFLRESIHHSLPLISVAEENIIATEETPLGENGNTDANRPENNNNNKLLAEEEKMAEEEEEMALRT